MIQKTICTSVWRDRHKRREHSALVRGRGFKWKMTCMRNLKGYKVSAYAIENQSSKYREVAVVMDFQYPQ